MATVLIGVETAPPVEVDVPKSAVRIAQVGAAITLIGLAVGLGLLLVQAIQDGQAGAAAVVALLLALPGFVLVLWTAAVLGVGVGPRQLVELADQGASGGFEGLEGERGHETSRTRGVSGALGANGPLEL